MGYDLFQAHVAVIITILVYPDVFISVSLCEFSGEVVINNQETLCRF